MDIRGSASVSGERAGRVLSPGGRYDFVPGHLYQPSTDVERLTRHLASAGWAAVAMAAMILVCAVCTVLCIVALGPELAA